MRSTKPLIKCLCLVLLLAGISQAKDWRGITPLRSTRADVERLLGPPTSPGGSDYALKNEHVTILYAGNPCEKGSKYGWNVPPDTVLTITVSSRKEQKVSDLKLDLNKYKIIREQSGHLPEVIYYVNEEEGISLESRENLDVVLSITYSPTARDSHALRCLKVTTKSHLRCMGTISY